MKNTLYIFKNYFFKYKKFRFYFSNLNVCKIIMYEISIDQSRIANTYIQ